MAPLCTTIIIHSPMRLIARQAQHFASSHLAPKMWTKIDDYEIIGELGKGASSRVFQGVHLLSGEKVVIKIFKQSIPPEMIKKEIEVNKRLLEGLPEENRQIKFMHLFSTIYDKPSKAYTLIYRYYPGVPLKDYIGGLSTDKVIKSAFKLAHTINYIHSMGYIHRDIKPNNILITPKGPRLFDFGLVKPITEEGLKTNNFGTKCYKVPEVVYQMDKYGQQVDIWALGLVFAELLLKKKHLLKYQTDEKMRSQVATFCSLPQEDRHLINEQFRSKVKTMAGKSWLQLAKQGNVDQQVAKLVHSMLAINPQKRPSLDQVVSHPIFAHIPKK